VGLETPGVALRLQQGARVDVVDGLEPPLGMYSRIALLQEPLS
jgi:hypothetical protein